MLYQPRYSTPPRLSDEALNALIAAAPDARPLALTGEPISDLVGSLAPTPPKPKPKPRHRRAGSPTPRRRREKVFGDGRPRPMDRNLKTRIMHLAQALMHRTEKGKAYGALTAKFVAVLEALLWQFHNARSGLCFPSYETIAEKAGCARSTVGDAIHALEGVGLLSWVNRLVRAKVKCKATGVILVRLIRTSNGYRFHDPRPAGDRPDSSKTDFPSVTKTQESISSLAVAKTAEIYQSTDPRRWDDELEAAMLT